MSKDISRRKIIPAHIVHAHDEGVLHYHDMDLAMQQSQLYAYKLRRYASKWNGNK